MACFGILSVHRINRNRLSGALPVLEAPHLPGKITLVVGLAALIIPLTSSLLVYSISPSHKGPGHACLTLRSTRTPPALLPALSQLLAFSAPLNASVQAGPVSFIR